MAFQRRLLPCQVLSTALLANAWQLLDRNCWPDFSLHYGLCCHDELPADPRCFSDGLTRERCCRCPGDALDRAAGRRRNVSAPAASLADGEVYESEQDDASAPAFSSALGLRLSRLFFGPLLCDGPSVRSRREDFLVPQVDGSRRLLRVFVYELPRRFNADLLNRLQLGGWLLGSECDYGLTPCTEAKWNGLFSVYRQFASEVLVLLKFLAAPPGVLTTDPTEADIFLVPYLAKTDCAESGNGGRDPCWGKCKCATAIKHLFGELPHFNWATRGRHLFLATGDFKDLPVEIQAQPLVLSLGASFCGGHLVVPSPNLDPALQPGGSFETREAGGRAPERHIFAYWFGSNDKTWRRKVLAQLSAYREQPGARLVVLHEIGSDYEARDVWQTDASSPGLVLEEMFRSTFCPILQGDVPHQKRLFDAVLTGCVPVVVAFPSHVPGRDSWWLPGGPPVERMLPFPDEVDWRALVLEVPAKEVEAGRFVPALLRVSEAELRRRQAALGRARSKLRFDFQATGPDAFSLTVQGMWRFLRRQGWTGLAAPGRAGVGTVGTGADTPGTAATTGAGTVGFDCGVPPALGRSGTLMYGHMACCLHGEVSAATG